MNAIRQYITTALRNFPGSTSREILKRISGSAVEGIALSRADFNVELTNMQALRLIEHDSGSPARWSLSSHMSTAFKPHTFQKEEMEEETP